MSTPPLMYSTVHVSPTNTKVVTNEILVPLVKPGDDPDRPIYNVVNRPSNHHSRSSQKIRRIKLPQAEDDDGVLNDDLKFIYNFFLKKAK